MPCPLRILAWLNIVGTGMYGPEVEQGGSQMDAKASAALVKKYSGVIAGVKTPLSKRRRNGFVPVERTRLLFACNRFGRASYARLRAREIS